MCNIEMIWESDGNQMGERMMINHSGVWSGIVNPPNLHRNPVVILVPSDDMPRVKISVIVANHQPDEVIVFSLTHRIHVWHIC